jgi:hypothetical protein
VSPLEAVLKVFASKNGSAWKSFNRVKDIAWRDANVIEDYDVVDLQATHSRSGAILLAGFGTAELPNGKLGFEANIRHDNEGYCGLTLSGNAGSVHCITVVKFYASANCQQIMQWQFASSAAVKPMAGAASNACSPGENSYQICIARASRLCLTSAIDEIGSKCSPGSTTFVFTKINTLNKA